MFRTLCEERLRQEVGVRSGAAALVVQLCEKRFQTAAHHLATLIEGRFNHAAQQALVATRVAHIVARHANHGALHFRRRIEHARLDGEEVFHVVPQLYEHTQDTIGLVARSRGQSFGHFLLNHARAAGDVIPIFEHLEKDLARNVVGIIAREYKLLSVEDMLEVHFQKVVFDDLLFELGEVLAEIVHTLKIDFGHLHLAPLRQEKLGEHSHARSHFENRQVGTGIDRVGNGSRHTEIFQKVLAEELFRTYGLHTMG